jgi:hypothetical protein
VFCLKTNLFCLKTILFYSKTILFCPAIQFTVATDRRFRATRGKAFLLFQPCRPKLISMDTTFMNMI